MTVFRAAHSLKKAVHYSLLLPKTPLLTTRRHAIAYTDGSCFNPGRRNAKAGFGVFWYDGCEYNCCGKVTGIQDNNRAELCAACRAIRMAYNLKETEITIKTDSPFVIYALETPKDGRG
ncbi:hypothetical protein GCK72_007640 [Caenorhabditis remanei]|nr:hypothetical protein GCK72_007640 [Caenorhabditis remanei]KAF1767681.1 hypothetical protein GCK72_007640 [Caenorhabditis remanei]